MLEAVVGSMDPLQASDVSLYVSEGSQMIQASGDGGGGKIKLLGALESAVKHLYGMSWHSQMWKVKF